MLARQKRGSRLFGRDSRSQRQSGFSLIELLIVLAVMLIASAFTIPLIMTSVSQYRLRTSAVDLNGLLQRARIRAVRDNRTYAVRTATFTQGAFSYSQAYLDLNGNSILDAGEPMIQLQRGVSLNTNPGAAAISNATLGFAPQSTTAQVNFNARGTPCVVVNTICSSWDSAAATPNQVGFVYYLRSTSGANTSWAAVSISPSGRFRSWSNYNNSTWGY
jgi:prepilin-type N-terminal cleavage/methylation domain-containing protein